MRRLLLASVALLLALRIEPAATAGPEPTAAEWILDVSRPSLVRVDTRRVPGMTGKRVGVWRGSVSDGNLIATSPAGDSFTFVAVPETPGERSRFILRTDPPPAELGKPQFVQVETEYADSTSGKVFGAVAAADPKVYDHAFPLWYLAKIEPNGSVDVSVPIPESGPAADAEVTIAIGVVPTHAETVSIQGTWGNLDLETRSAVTINGGAVKVVTFTCAAKDVPPAGTALRLTDRTGALPPRDPQDVSDDRGAIWIAWVSVHCVTKAHKGSISILADGKMFRLEEIDGTARLRPHVAPPDPVAAAAGADEVILATKPLIPGATRLAAHRTKTGVKAVVVPAADVLDGATDARPVRAYFEAIAKTGKGPRFVLLCGDATYDRTDLVADETIPTMYARTQYNGATASDRLLVLPTPDAKSGGPAIGRLPFRDPKDMEAFVDRLIAYETRPPADATRRMLRFVTSEGRFGTQADAMIENLFRRILADHIPPAYDVEVTFASVASAFCWPPPEFNEKVIDGINEGALFETYVGHGWWNGFDALRVGNRKYPILRDSDVPRIAIHGTPSAMFVIACTTAEFDSPEHDAVGELLMKRPKGPVAYFGATRVCHPVWNSMVGRRLAMDMFGRKNARLGEIIQGAEDEVVVPTEGVDKERKAIELVAGSLLHVADLNPIYLEGSRMYALLGDPATKVAFPAADLAVEVEPAGSALAVTVSAPGLADGTEVTAALEVWRNATLSLPPLEKTSADPEGYASMKKRHDAANDMSVAKATAKASGGKATFSLEVPDARRGQTLFVKAFALYGGDAHVGSARFAVPAAGGR